MLIPQRRSLTAAFMFGCSIDQSCKRSYSERKSINFRNSTTPKHKVKHARLLMYQAFDQKVVGGGTPEGHWLQQVLLNQILLCGMLFCSSYHSLQISKRRKWISTGLSLKDSQLKQCDTATTSTTFKKYWCAILYTIKRSKVNDKDKAKNW